MTRQCMSCGHHGMVRDEDHQEHLRFNGESVVLTGLTGWFCPVCGDGELDPESSVRFATVQDDLIHRARARQREEIRRIRKKLRLTQSEAAKLTGGGRNAFSRYERGEVSPMPAVLHLLHLLDRHPELLQEIERG
ncbi:type II toxin-antitoxin system MqsA family antitoxin [Acidithiobacillus marinus]|nr:type II toxin-antitoxin system MqsA family antitoxin [Acidithiobacillus marinus]